MVVEDDILFLSLEGFTRLFHCWEMINELISLDLSGETGLLQGASFFSHNQTSISQRLRLPSASLQMAVGTLSEL